MPGHWHDLGQSLSPYLEMWNLSYVSQKIIIQTPSLSTRRFREATDKCTGAWSDHNPRPIEDVGLASRRDFEILRCNQSYYKKRGLLRKMCGLSVGCNARHTAIRVNCVRTNLSVLME